MTAKRRRVAACLLGGLAVTLTGAAPASATDGYFQVGFGMRQNAMGGAGVADSTDAMAQALNPAGIVGVGDQWQVGAALFMPYRGYDTDGSGPFDFAAPGPVESDANLSAIPNFAYVRQIDGQSAWGLSIYGNGGMNTSYPDVSNPFCGGGSGVFCAGEAGVDLMQAFVSLTYARQFGAVKVGIAPTLAVQRFKAYGLDAFIPYSMHMDSVTGNGYDYSVGGGVRGGVEWEAMPGLRFALSGQTRMYMSKFDKYSGLFAEEGGFDIPASITAGVAFDLTPAVTVALDYQRIFYGGVQSISNGFVPAPLGADGGPGFGWHDVDVFKIGAEWRASETWTLRAGYAYSDNPIGSTDVTLNILAPGVVQHHITGGASYKLSDRNTIEFSGMYVPETTVTGYEAGFSGSNAPREITLDMHQFQFGVGLTRTF